MSGFLLKAFRSQEMARERNKREEKKLTLNLSGKSGPEAVYKFNTDKVNKEQKVIARELARIRTMRPAKSAAGGDLLTLNKEQNIAERQLEKIRQGIHKPTNKTQLTPDKKFHHPVFNFTDIPVSEANTNDTLNEMTNTKEHMNFPVDLKGRLEDNDDGAIDGFMIIKYLGDLHNADKSDRKPLPSEKSRSPVYHSPVNHNHQIDIDTPRLAFKRLSEIGKIDSNQAELSHSEVTLPGKQNKVINSVPTSDAQSAEEKGCVVKVTSKEHVLATERPTKRKKEQTNSFTASSLVPQTTLRTQQNTVNKSKDLDLATLAAVDMSSVRNKVSRRLSKDYITGHGSALSDPGSNRKQGNRKGSTSAGPDLPTAANNSCDSGTPSSRSDTDDTRPRLEKRISKHQLDEMLKKPVYDPEMYNPDGSLKTMHTLPSFEKSWQEAQKARYIRTKDKLERDRELTTKEIFS